MFDVALTLSCFMVYIQNIDLWGFFSFSHNMKIILIFALFSLSDCKKNKPKCDCGIIPKPKMTKNSRIFKGKDASPYQYPWQVWIEVDFFGVETEKPIRNQGGVLISKGHILTAAHIFYFNYGINDR